MSTELDTDKKDKLHEKLIRSRLVKSVISGIILTFVSLIIIGFNLSTNSGIKINDDINRYFDTCVGEFFTSTTPLIDVDERGFPLSYVQTTNIPICNDRGQAGSEVQWTSYTSFEFGAFIANVLFWTCITFVLLRTYIKRKHIKVTRSA